LHAKVYSGKGVHLIQTHIFREERLVKFILETHAPFRFLDEYRVAEEETR